MDKETPWQLALELVWSDIQDAMSDEKPSAWYDAAGLAVADSPEHSDIAAELSSLAAEAILRLAVIRCEDPRETLTWLTDVDSSFSGPEERI